MTQTEKLELLDDMEEYYVRKGQECSLTKVMTYGICCYMLLKIQQHRQFVCSFQIGDSNGIFENKKKDCTNTIRD